MKKLILFLMICIGITNVSAQYKTLPNVILKDLDGNNV